MANLQGNIVVSIPEENLEQKSNLGMTDYVRIVGSDGVSYKQGLNDVSDKIITEHNDTQLGGVAQSVKQAIDTLDNSVGSLQSDNVQTQIRIDSLQAAVGTPLVASTVAGMTDHDKIYVYVGSESGYTNGHWYYWDGSAWADGGVYNSTAFETDKTLTLPDRAADAKVVGDKIAEVKSELKDVIENEHINLTATATIVDGYFVRYDTGLLYSSVTGATTDYIQISDFSKLVYSRRVSTGSGVAGIAFYDENKTYISGQSQITGGSEVTYVETEVEIPTNAVFVRASLWPDSVISQSEFYIKGISVLKNTLNKLASDMTDLKDICTEEKVVNTVYVSGGLTSSYSETPNVSRIRMEAANMPLLRTGDIINIGGIFEGKVLTVKYNQYSTDSVIHETEWMSGEYVIPSVYDRRYFGLLLRDKNNTSADISGLVESVSSSVIIKHLTSTDDLGQSIERNNFISNLGIQESVISGTVPNKAWNIEGGVATLEEIIGWREKRIDVSEGDVFVISAAQGEKVDTRIWALTDSDYNIVSMASDYSTEPYILHTDYVVVPNGAVNLCMTIKADVSYQSWKKLNIKYPIDKGLLQDLNITELIDCTRYGYYRSGASYTANITDLPIDFSNTSFILSVENPAYVSDQYCRQTLLGSDGNSWLRNLKFQGSEWTVYSDWKKIQSPSAISLRGKKLSLLGASISAYAGYIPEGNRAYYTGSNAGVSNVSQMWWNVLCKETAMSPLVINAWSGSGITQLTGDHADRVPMSDDSRCKALDDGTNNPDIILIIGGTNDWTYAAGDANLPLAWDGKTTPILTNSFTEALAVTVKKVQETYPNAIVVLCSTVFCQRDTDNGYTYTHEVNGVKYTMQDYDEAIEFVANAMRIPYLNCNKIGFNRYNYYPTYCQDSASQPTHPNALGHAKIGAYMAQKLNALIGSWYGE